MRPEYVGYRHDEPCAPPAPMERLEQAMEAIPAVMAERRTMPSRAYLTRQAVLNAAFEEMPVSGRLLPHYLAGRCSTGLQRQFAALVRSHFRDLVAQYGGTTCLSP